MSSKERNVMLAQLSQEMQAQHGYSHPCQLGAPSAAQKAVLRLLVRNAAVSFSNGSAYDEETLPSGRFDGVSIVGTSTTPGGWACSFADGSACFVPMGTVSVGPGADFGKHYNTRKQALRALMD
jgi:hypothetical protein